MVWNVTGHVKLNIIQTAGNNAVVSGVFFGANSTVTSSAAFLRTDTTTQGNWHGTYGSDGYSVANDSQAVPAYASFAVQNQQDYTWSNSPTDARSLQTGSASGRIAAVWYNTPEFNFDVNFTDGNSHQFALYAVDSDNSGRAETIQILDAATDALLDTRSISNFTNGLYLAWNVSGHIKINVILTAGNNSVVSGIFFGGGSTINSTASFVRTDTTTQGSWHGTYGSDGYSIANDSQSLPSYANFAVQNQANWTWLSSTTDPRALQTGNNSGSIAATWYNTPEFNLDVNLTDGQSHQLALYAMDWDSSGRAETVELLDAATGALLDTRNISSFVNGLYLVWNVSGHIKINIIQTAGNNAVVSGIFFATPVPLPSITGLSPTSAAINTPVTITGTGFGTTRGGGNVQLGSINGVVASWSDTQIVAVVAPNSTSGTVQVLQSGASSNAVNFTVGTPTIISVSPTNGAVGTQVTISGTGFGTPQSNGRVLLGSTIGLVMSWSDTSVVANVATGSSSGAAQVFQNGVWSNSVNFSVSSPTVTSVTPTSGVAGAQVTIIGSGFGTTQGNGGVMVGTAYGSVVSWSDTQVVATIASGSASGAAQIRQGGVWSNSITFTVFVPTITSVSPASGAAGTQVTITGSGFGPAQANGKVWLGTTYGSVVNWSDTQVLVTVVTGSANGTAQILQNGVWSNSLPFPNGTPRISGVTPSSAAAGAQVTIAGSGFGATQGTGGVFLGSTNGLVVNWNDTQIVANVASQSLTGIVRVTQNGMSSNYLRFVVPTVGSGNNACLVPHVISMVVGETRSIQALDMQSHPILGLTWTSSDVTVVSLSADDAPLLSALAPGHVTVTAGDSSADVTVISGLALSPGAILWSSPGDGTGITQTVPAVPSPTGVADVFALQASGNVQAVRDDGTVAWTAPVGGGNKLLPDFQGGLVVSAVDSVKRYDGITGQQVFAHAFVNPPNLPGPLHNNKHVVAIHADGTIFVVDGNLVAGLDSQTGATKFTVPIDNSSYRTSSDCLPQNDAAGSYAPFIGPAIIAGDGYFYLPYEYLGSVRNETYYDATTTPPLCNSLQNDDSHLRLLRVGTDGSAQKTNLGDWTGFYSGTYGPNGIINSFNPVPNGDFESLITNADAGALFTWSLTYPEGCAYESAAGNSGCFPTTWDIKVTDTSTGITTSTGHTLPAPVLQAQDGTFIGNAINTDDWTTINLAGFNQNGTVKWSGPPNYQALFTTSDGGTIALSDSGQYVTLDQTGNVTGQLASLPSLSWKGAYQASAGSLDSVVPADFTLATSFAATRGPSSAISPDFLENGLDPTPSGNLTGNGFALVHHSFGLFWCGAGYGLQGYIAGSPCMQNDGNDVRWGYYQTSQGPSGFQGFLPQHSEWPGIILNEAFKSFRAAYAQYPITVQLASFKADSTPEQEYVAYVLGTSPWPGYGLTIRTTPISKVYYFGFMEGAQEALGKPENPSTGAGWIKYSPSDPTQDVTTFTDMVHALGKAIGNGAAHEIGHHLEDYGSTLPIGAFPNMDCGASPENIKNPGVPCEHDDNFVYAFFNGRGLPQYGTTSSGAMFFYGVPGGTQGIPSQPAIHWGPSDACWLQNYSAPGSCKR